MWQRFPQLRRFEVPMEFSASLSIILDAYISILPFLSPFSPSLQQRGKAIHHTISRAIVALEYRQNRKSV